MNFDSDSDSVTVECVRYECETDCGLVAVRRVVVALCGLRQWGDALEVRRLAEAPPHPPPLLLLPLLPLLLLRPRAAQVADVCGREGVIDRRLLLAAGQLEEEGRVGRDGDVSVGGGGVSVHGGGRPTPQLASVLAGGGASLPQVVVAAPHAQQVPRAAGQPALPAVARPALAVVPAAVVAAAAGVPPAARVRCAHVVRDGVREHARAQLARHHTRRVRLDGHRIRARLPAARLRPPL